MAACLFFVARASANAQRRGQTANVHQSDRMLFERAQKAIQKSNYAEARNLLETLIDTHPASDYVPRAKISIADSYYSQQAFRQAELEYRDFITFFPNRPEVADAQHRIDSIDNKLSF